MDNNKANAGFTNHGFPNLDMDSTKRKKYLVTGAAGSIGSAVTQLLAADGHTVFAGDINTETLDAHNPETVVPLPLDVTSEKSVRAAEAEVGKQCRGLDGIINIAGIFKTGALVETEEAVFKSMLETNVTGMYRVNRIFFDLLFAKRGRHYQHELRDRSFGSLF